MSTIAAVSDVTSALISPIATEWPVTCVVKTSPTEAKIVRFRSSTRSFVIGAACWSIDII
jgi:hypothetical protein